MRKTSYWLLIVLSTLICISCGKDEPELSSINPGLYEINHDIKYAGQLVILKQRVRYNAEELMKRQISRMTRRLKNSAENTKWRTDSLCRTIRNAD